MSCLVWFFSCWFLNLCFLVIFPSRVGGWEILSRPVVFETGSVGGQAMDLMIHAAAFGLGMRKSNIKLPWEKEPVNPVFYKRPRLIAPPSFVAVAPVVDDAVSLPIAEAEGRLKWSRKTSLVPWPVAQDRALAKALESWRLIIMDDMEGSLVGRQIAKSLRGEDGAQPVEQILSDALAGKSLSTLRARASSLMAFGRWKKGLDPMATILPIAEEQAYAYVRELRELNAPRTKPGRFLEAVAFAFHMLGAEVDGTMSSPRVKGAVVVPVVIPKKKEPLTVRQIAFLENLAMDDSGQLGIFAGYCCMVLHMVEMDGRSVLSAWARSGLLWRHRLPWVQLVSSQECGTTETFSEASSSSMQHSWLYWSRLGVSMALSSFYAWPSSATWEAYYAGSSCGWGLGEITPRSSTDHFMDERAVAELESYRSNGALGNAFS